MKKSILFLIAILTTSVIFAQNRTKDTIDTEEITVLRPYSPSVSDAFKIKVNPEITDSIAKKQVNYSIFSVPVASTFTPAKGKAKVLRVDPSAPVYENFITAGFGNFSTPQAEVFFRTSSNDYNEFGGFINYHSSQGGVKDAILDDNFLDTRVDLFFKQEERDFDWQLNGGFRYQKYNWYGLSDDIDYTQDVIDNIIEDLNYTEIYFGGIIDYADSFFQGASAELYRFSDDEGSSELYLVAKPKIEFPIASELINAEARIEFLTGDFFQNYDATSDIGYTFFNAGFNPNFEVLRDNLTINLGADLVYSAASGVAESKGYIYPKVTASYILIDQVLTAYAGVTGGLHQNSFRDFTSENPFVSPTLNIQRTDEQYNAYGGLKGKLASNVSYNFRGGFKNERDKALFKLNPSKTDGTVQVAKGYEAANSFQVVYDEIS
ncbi:MAG: TonB-dependent receptor, partial [Flavobacteriaceae bacterium]|nr:TonB-dependent receptor [Flavobacteriaceae bacterium]